MCAGVPVRYYGLCYTLDYDRDVRTFRTFRTWHLFKDADMNCRY